MSSRALKIELTGGNMHATKCDRCKKYFEKEIPRIGYMRTKADGYYQLLDICPECLTDFLMFMGEKANDGEPTEQA